MMMIIMMMTMIIMMMTMIIMMMTMIIIMTITIESTKRDLLRTGVEPGRDWRQIG